MTNAQAWAYAVGMIRVDVLEPTQGFKDYVEKENVEKSIWLSSSIP